jgi:uncharacterized protein
MLTQESPPVARDTSLGPSHHLVALARRARRLPNLLVVLVVGTAIFIGSEALGGLPAVFILRTLTGEEPRTLLISPSPLLSGLYLAIILVASFIGIYLLLWLWLRWYEKRPFWTLGLEPTGVGWNCARGAFTGILMLAVSVGLMALLGYVAFEDGPTELQGVSALGGVLIVLVGWIAQGPAEELLCRGWMLPVVAARYRLWIGILVSSAFFAVGHSLNPNISAIALVNLVLYGLFAALYALREGSIWGIAANHAFWNWAQGNLFGFEVSGLPSSGGMLINLMETGPDEITGGPFGPEGGLALTAVLLASIALLLAWRRRPLPTERREPSTE